MSIIVDKILFLMKTEGMTAKQLTTALGLAPSAISEWKKGKAKPSAEAIIKIADYFNVSTDYLLVDAFEEPISKLNLDDNELGLLNHYREQNDTKQYFGPLQNYFPHAVILSEEQQELLKRLRNKKDETTQNGQSLSPLKIQLLDKAQELSDDEIKKIIEYADFVKSQRKQ